MEWLKGKKTYLCAAGVGIVAVLVYLGVIDNQIADVLYGFLGAGAVAALRAAK